MASSFFGRTTATKTGQKTTPGKETAVFGLSVSYLPEVSSGVHHLVVLSIPVGPEWHSLNKVFDGILHFALGRCYLLHVHPRVSAFVGEGAHHGDKPNPLWACFGTETLVLEQFPKSDLMHSAA